MPDIAKEPEIPKIPLKVIRVDDKIKFEVGKYSLTVKPIKDTSQTYDFVIVEQFITNTAQLLYSEIIKKEQIKKDIHAAFTGGAEEQNEQDMISKLLGDK